MPIVATRPEVNSIASASTPSEKITPPSGMWDSMRRESPGPNLPAARSTPDERLRNGSRTTNTRRGSPRGIVTGGSAGALPPSSRRFTASAMLRVELSQPVEPAPVETITPLDDCSSVFPFHESE